MDIKIYQVRSNKNIDITPPVSTSGDEALAIAQAAQTSALLANSKIDTLGNKTTSFIRITGKNKPVDTGTLSGIDASGTITVETVVGDAFSAGEGSEVGRVIVNRTCIATIIGYGTGTPDATGTNDIVNGNFRLLIRKRVGSISGASTIFLDCRVPILKRNHTSALDLPITVQVNEGDRISVETCCYDTDRGLSNIALTLIEHPNTVSLDSNVTNQLTQIVTELADIKTRLTALENK